MRNNKSSKQETFFKHFFDQSARHKKWEPLITAYKIFSCKSIERCKSTKELGYMKKYKKVCQYVCFVTSSTNQYLDVSYLKQVMETIYSSYFNYLKNNSFKLVHKSIQAINKTELYFQQYLLLLLTEGNNSFLQQRVLGFFFTLNFLKTNNHDFKRFSEFLQNPVSITDLVLYISLRTHSITQLNCRKVDLQIIKKIVKHSSFVQNTHLCQCFQEFSKKLRIDFKQLELLLNDGEYALTYEKRFEFYIESLEAPLQKILSAQVMKTIKIMSQIFASSEEKNTYIQKANELAISKLSEIFFQKVSNEASKFYTLLEVLFNYQICQITKFSQLVLSGSQFMDLIPEQKLIEKTQKQIL